MGTLRTVQGGPSAAFGGLEDSACQVRQNSTGIFCWESSFASQAIPVWPVASLPKSPKTAKFLGEPSVTDDSESNQLSAITVAILEVAAVLAASKKGPETSDSAGTRINDGSITGQISLMLV